MRSRPLQLGVRICATVSLTAMLAACVHTTPSIVHAPGPDPILINADYRAGRVEIPTTPVASLEQILDKVPTQTRPVNEEDRLRAPALQEAAFSYGAQAGLAWESHAINLMLQQQAPEISRVYDFQRVIIRGPDNVMILPPVISRMDETWESSEAGKTLRVADTYYEIIEQARFAPVAPLWQTYLIRSYETPAAPPDVLLPRDRSERESWRASVAQGWEMGRQRAQDIFKADISRLERDFTGMVRYKSLLEEGLVSAPVVADARMGTTGTGQDMRVNDRAIRITQDPSLQVESPTQWTASPTTPTTQPQATAATTGADPSAPTSVCPEGTVPAVPQVASQPACVSVPVPPARPVVQSKSRAAWF